MYYSVNYLQLECTIVQTICKHVANCVFPSHLPDAAPAGRPGVMVPKFAAWSPGSFCPGHWQPAVPVGRSQASDGPGPGLSPGSGRALYGPGPCGHSDRDSGGVPQAVTQWQADRHGVTGPPAAPFRVTQAGTQ